MTPARDHSTRCEEGLRTCRNETIEFTHLFPVSPASPSTTLTSAASTGEASTTSLRVSSPSVTSTTAAGVPSASHGTTSTHSRSLAVHERKAGLVLGMEVRERTCGAAAESGLTVATPAAGASAT